VPQKKKKKAEGEEKVKKGCLKTKKNTASMQKRGVEEETIGGRKRIFGKGGWGINQVKPGREGQVLLGTLKRWEQSCDRWFENMRRRSTREEESQWSLFGLGVTI